MSLFTLPQNLQIKHRGIKVDGYTKNRNGTIDLSWNGQSKSKMIKKYSTIKNSPTHSQQQQKDFRKVKVMTDTSGDEQELLKLIKTRQKSNKDRNDDLIKARSRQQQYVQKNQRSDVFISKSPPHHDISSRIRYLENNLLPKCRQDNVNLILDQSLNEQVSLSQSRHQQHPHLKKNQSQRLLDQGYNPFSPKNEKMQDLTKRLQQMYEYQDNYNRRMNNCRIKLG